MSDQTSPTPIGQVTEFGTIAITRQIRRLTREKWMARRIATRYVERGDQFTLRRTSIVGSPVGFVNPLLYAPDIQISTAVVVDGQTYIGLRASSLDGRLRVGDQMTVSFMNRQSVTWTVLPVLPNVRTDEYGAQLAEPDGTPYWGPPTVYYGEPCAQDNALLVVPVLADVEPADVALFIGSTPVFSFQADEPIYGTSLSARAMTAMGWTEITDIGLSVSATAPSGATIERPKVDDQIIINNIARNVMTVNENSRRDSKFIYSILVR